MPQTGSSVPTLITASNAADATICNTVVPPTAGVHVGGGLHVVIPSDWQSRCTAGEKIPGCTSTSINPDGSMNVSDAVKAQLAIPAIANALPDQVALTALNTKIGLGVAVP